MPKPLPWDWARPRLVPLLAGQHLGPELVTVLGRPGCAVIFGVEVNGAHLLVDRQVARRWETSDAQLEAAAMRNLDRRAARLTPSDVRTGTLAGRIVRVLDQVPWASSLLLSPEHLVRVFGAHDQVFGTPKRGVLMSFSADVPTRVIAHIVVDAEVNAAWPLLLDPFFLENGQLLWQDLDELGDRWLEE